MHVITQICVLFLWMHMVTFVTSEDCTLEAFINSRKYDSNFDTTELESSYPPGKQVRVGCNVGFSGFFKLICLENGWKTVGSKCTPQQCPVIRVENNVQVIGDLEEGNYGTVIRFSCKIRNQILEGPSEIYCDENGQWSGTAPICKEVTCAQPKIENGNVLYEKPVYKEHEILEFECDRKYKRSTGIPSKCTKLGTTSVWSPTPSCEPIKCELNQLEGTSHDPPYKNVFSPGETVRVTCDEKYWVSTRQEVSAVSTCQETGEWTIRPICLEVTCSDRQPPNMDYWERRWRWLQRTQTLGDTRRFSCRYGYKSAGGARSVTCTRDGWKPDPACQEITCDREDVPNTDIDGEYKQEYKLGQHIRYVCKDGYEGRFTRTCGENGWIRYQSEGCREITCRRENVHHADIDRSTSEYKSEYKYNEQVNYVCKPGYEGGFTLTCGNAGWIGNHQCTILELLGCEPPPALDHGDIKYTIKSQYNHSERVEYMCQLYHTMEGEPNRICINGEWTGHMRCLKPCTLNEDDTRQHNITLKLSDKKFFLHDEIIEFECAHGVPVGDVAMRQRCNGGVVLLPTCQ